MTCIIKMFLAGWLQCHGTVDEDEVQGGAGSRGEAKASQDKDAGFLQAPDPVLSGGDLMLLLNGRKSCSTQMLNLLAGWMS